MSSLAACSGKGIICCRYQQREIRTGEREYAEEQRRRIQQRPAENLNNPCKETTGRFRAAYDRPY